MSPVKVRKITKELKRKGFCEINKRRHYAYCFIHEGKRTSIITIISRGESEYSDSLLSHMKKELRLSKEQFDGVIDCSIMREDLLNIYLSNGIIKN